MIHDLRPQLRKAYCRGSRSPALTRLGCRNLQFLGMYNLTIFSGSKRSCAPPWYLSRGLRHKEVRRTTLSGLLCLQSTREVRQQSHLLDHLKLDRHGYPVQIRVLTSALCVRKPIYTPLSRRRYRLNMQSGFLSYNLRSLINCVLIDRQ